MVKSLNRPLLSSSRPHHRINIDRVLSESPGIPPREEEIINQIRNNIIYGSARIFRLSVEQGSGIRNSPFLCYANHLGKCRYDAIPANIWRLVNKYRQVGEFVYHYCPDHRMRLTGAKVENNRAEPTIVRVTLTDKRG